jgi:photosynthetic reaction center cytochrome c subunit
MVRRSQLTGAAQILALSLSVFLVLLCGVTFSRGQSASSAAPTQDKAVLAEPLRRAPTGASRCMFCHPGEVEGYARSAMAHSLRRAGQEPDGTVSAHGSRITVRSSPAGYWQHWENGGDSSDYRVDFVVGSGNHASGYLVDIGGHLFQSPVAFYTSRKSYDLAPGYENVSDPDFTRPVSEECVLCHSGTALHIAGTLNQYRPPIFAAEAITCELCHGPVERHLTDPRAGTIVNPAKLEPAARDSVCEQCHLFGVARVPNPGKKLSDFIPGQRLEDTFTIYRNALPPGAPAGSFKVISHVEQLALSACARNSGGRLWCGTCHNPHDKPLQTVQYYRARCLTCHTSNFPAAHPGRDTDCLSCHMPRRSAEDGGHTVFTDHRIQRRPETGQADLSADAGIAAWREPPPELEKRNLGIAYIDVGMQRHSSAFIIQGYRTLTEVQRQFTNDSDFFKWIGEALLVGKQTADAKLALERALQLDPDSPVTEAGAASPYIEEGDADRAIAHLERAVTLDPLYLPAASTLIELYRSQGKTAEAVELSARIKAAMNETADGRQGAQKPSAETPQKKAEEVFKNIRMLKGIPAEQLVPSMEFMSSSLGVDCNFCHVEDHFEKDDKKPKQTAREMMQMMIAINKSSFEGQREVTCYSCHRGARNPVDTPIVEGEIGANAGAGNTEAQKLPTDLPTASELLEKYVGAVGGARAIASRTSRIVKGRENFRGQSTALEIFSKAPNKQAVVRHYAKGDSVTVFDGDAAWFRTPGRQARDLHGADLDAARLDADLQFPLHIPQHYSALHVEYPEKIGERESYVLLCAEGAAPAAKLYFDAQSRLLVRVVRYKESALGVNPEQIDYSDYRDVDGVRLPFRITVSGPTSSSTIQIDEVEDNVPVDEARFSRPPS